MRESKQQARVYEAQCDVSRGVVFTNITAAQDYADALTATRWWTERYPEIVRLEVQAIRSTKWAGCSESDTDRNCGVIGLASSGLHESTLLHEAAHCVTPVESGHEWPFTRALLEITYLRRGTEAYQALREAFLRHGVDINTPTRDRITP